MKGGRWRALGGLIRRGREVEDGTGAALRTAYEKGLRDPMAGHDGAPMEMEADEAMRRCIEQLEHVEGTLKGRLGDGSKG